MSIPACRHDACESGRKPCPFPQSCVLPQADAQRFGLLSERMFIWCVILIVVLFAALEVTCQTPGGCAP